MKMQIQMKKLKIKYKINNSKQKYYLLELFTY